LFKTLGEKSASFFYHMKFIDSPYIYNPDSDSDYAFALWSSIRDLSRDILVRRHIDFNIEYPTSFPSGSLLTEIRYMIDDVKCLIVFSKFGRLFSILEDFRIKSGSSRNVVWEQPLNIEIVQLFSSSGFIYIDATYASSNTYEGEHKEFEELTIYERYFSEMMN